MKVLTVDWHWRWELDPHARRRYANDLEAVLVIETPGRWIRLGVFYGSAPGSHMIGQHFTTWYTDCGPGQVHGRNVRFGWWPEPCVTLLAHTRPHRLGDTSW